MVLLKQLKELISKKEDIIATNISASTDFNTLTERGKYYFSSTPTGTNKPCGKYGVLEVLRNSGSFITQRYTVYDGSEVYTRGGHSGNWSEWRKNDGTVLWENSNPTATTFAAQEITLSSADYTYLEFYFKDGTSCICEKVAKGYDVNVFRLIGMDNNNLLSFRFRAANYINDTTYSITSGLYKNATTTSVGQNYDTMLIPLKVIGY